MSEVETCVRMSENGCARAHVHSIELCVYDPFISIIKLKKLRHGIKQLNLSQEGKSVKRLAYVSTLN